MAGGDSSECVISVQSAAQICEVLNHEKYEPFIITVKGPKWFMDDSHGNEHHIDKNDFSLKLDGHKIQFDCALIAIHGTPGENGILQSYFELTRIPYTTCGVGTSAITFNKYATKTYAREAKVQLARHFLVKRTKPATPDEIFKEVGLPCFVKPNQSGSSFGVTKVKSLEMLPKALNDAFTEDDEVLVEEFIDGIELTCGIYKSENHELIMPVTEIASKKEFFDYEAKYTPGLCDEITPARISPEITELVQQSAFKLYQWFSCKGIVRVDFIYSHNKLYLLELNTTPGMSKNSIIPQQIRNMGLTMTTVWDWVIEDTLNAFRQKK
jgi:D-alanine--D-alanine ligase